MLFGAASLVVVIILAPVSIGLSAFEGCRSLVELTFPDVPFVSGRSVIGAGLSSIVLPQCRRFVGDSIFENCVSLQSITLPSLQEVNQQSSRICANRSSLTSLSLPSSPPRTIHSDAFADCFAASLEVPSPEGDLADDDPPLVPGGVGLEFRQIVCLCWFSSSPTASADPANALTGTVTAGGHCRISKCGLVTAKDCLKAKRLITALVSLEITAETLSTLQALLRHGEIEGKGSALQEMARLRELDLHEMKNPPGRIVTGSTALETVDLPSLQAVQVCTFGGVTSLTEVTVR
jgi:hypothetical protein